MDLTEEVDSCSGKSVSKGGLYPPRVGFAASSEARAVIETQEVKTYPKCNYFSLSGSQFSRVFINIS